MRYNKLASIYVNACAYGRYSSFNELAVRGKVLDLNRLDKIR